MRGRMSMFRPGCLVCIMFVCGCIARLSAQGQSDASVRAEELLDRCQKTYLDALNYKVSVVQKELETRATGVADGGNVEPRIVTERYARAVLSRHQPDEWRVIFKKPYLGFIASKNIRHRQWMMLEAEETPSSVSTKKPSALKPTALQTVKADMSFLQNDPDPVISALLFSPESPAKRLFEDYKPVYLGNGTFNGKTLERIGFMKSSKTPVVVWIDESEGIICRTLEVIVWGEGRSRRVLETRYYYEFTQTDSDDLDPDKGMAQLSLSSFVTAGMFSTPSSVLEEAENVRSWVPAEQPAKAAGSASIASPAAPAAETQSLTPEQMEAIVLIEGEEGVGTGFVARIRGVDFVVTNLHVIGGNEKLRITTVKGVTVPVSGIFGAVGRDIAILRIEGENKVPPLVLTADPLRTAKLGDKIVVVGNRRGGGVATQLSGVVRGIGPDRLEVDAPFQPGNSGSPIVHLATGEVLGVASYSQTRKLDELDGPSATAADPKKTEPAKEEQRWFGFRADEVAKWETIDLAKWRLQSKRVADFAADTEAIYYAMHGKFEAASRNPRVKPLVDRLNERAARGGSQVVVTQEVGEFFRSLRALSQTGVKELKTGEYYDFFRTNDYWETSITQQLRVRADISDRLGKASETSVDILAKLRR